MTIYKKTDHFDGKRFFDPNNRYENHLAKLLKWRFTRSSPTWPKQILPSSFCKPDPRVHGSALRVTNVGHVTFLIQTESLNILTDPVWSNRASPFSFAGPKRVIEPGIKFEDLPDIDLILISHNHYDHLDLQTVDALWQRFKPKIITPLGNEKIIQKYNKEIDVSIFDWWDEIKINDQISVSLSPLQHWSARGIFDKDKALWGGLSILTPNGAIFFVGDSGYNQQYFLQAKHKYGPFRLALVPIGAYEPRWFMQYAHMNPQDAIKSYIDLGEPYFIPSHYDVFPLADENYGQALDDLQKAISLLEMEIRIAAKQKILITKVGESVSIPII